MNFDMPKAVFCGLALIAAAIYFGPGSVPAEPLDRQSKLTAGTNRGGRSSVQTPADLVCVPIYLATSGRA